MEPPKRKITAKVSSNNIHSFNRDGGANPIPSSSSSPSPSISMSGQVVRAKVSSTARTRADSGTSSPAQSKINGLTANVNGVLRHEARDVARRSPSPAKMIRPTSPTKASVPASRPTSPLKMPSSRPLSPSKPQHSIKQPTVRTTVSRSTLKPDGSENSRLTTKIFSSQQSSAPNSPVSRNGPAKWEIDTSGPVSHKPGSLRIKAKVTSMAKATIPSVSTIISPPSPSSMSSAISSPISTGPPARVRPMTSTRRPSVTFSVSNNRPASPEARLVPLPTSPPASTLSFSSHSSTSVSTGYTTSITPPISQTRRTLTPTSGLPNSLQMQLSALDEQKTASQVLLDDHDLASKQSSIRTLTARIRPGTRISRGWTSGSSIAGETNTSVRSLKSDGSTTEDTASESSDGDNNETRSRRKSRSPSNDPDLEVRAEAKSIRKIADLEITTASLLTINSNLEATKIRQAREIRELRRKLREARLAMPPKRFRLLAEDKSDQGGDGEANEDDDNEENDAEEEEEDETFHRLKSLVENLLAAGRSALAVPAPSFGVSIEHVAPSSPGEWEVGGAKHGVAIGSRVLSAEEARKWVGDDQQAQQEQREANGGTAGEGESPSHGDTGEEEEVEQAVGGVRTHNIIDYAEEDNSPEIPVGHTNTP
ncbi:hypothetical protein BU17DRAFT_86409 [Hysterangium stoloniferum]|nr:hypothetical protein BU17DRAFT_86409 [Hysterangium stoloniferum]